MDAPPPGTDELAAFATMLRLRRFEEKAGLLYALGTLATPWPLGVNQEGALAAVAAILRPEDDVLALPPTPALALALGSSPAEVLRGLATAADATHGCATGYLVRGPGHAVTSAATFPEAVSSLAGAADAPVLLLAAGADCAGSVGELMTRLELAGRPVVAVLVAPRDQRPEAAALTCFRSVHEIDGTDTVRIAAALAAARAEVAAAPFGRCLLVLTPPYVGHVRGNGARASSRQDAPDPIALSRRRLLETGAATDAQLSALDSTIRAEMAAAARALAMACEGEA